MVTHALADECNPSDPQLLKPDLTALPPSRVRMANQGGHRVLYFTTTIGNIGDGPMILHGKIIQGPNGPVTQATQEIFRSDGTSCTRVAGDFVFHGSHRHFHFEDFSNYFVRKDDPFTGEIVAQSQKVSFCLLDVMRLSTFHTFPQFQNDCENAEGTQGISVGFADVYDFLLPGQNIDLDADPAHPVPAGDYFLTNVVNPNGTIWENNSDPEANTGFVSVRVGEPSVNVGATNAATVTATPTLATDSPPDTPPTPTPTPSARRPQPPHVPAGPVLGPRTRFPHAPHNPTSVSRPSHAHAPHAPHAPRN
jgi:hypothetical protein